LDDAALVRQLPLKIIFINRFFYPDYSATSQLLSDLAFELARRGYEIQVITSRLSYEGSKKFPSRDNIRGVDVRRISTTNFGRGRIIGRAIDYLTFFLSAGYLLLRQARSGDIVVAKTDPPLISVLAIAIARLKGARRINWLQDLFPEVATALGFGDGTAKKGAMLLARWFRDRSLVRAHANIVLGVKMAERVKSRGVSDKRTVVIPNWAAGDHIFPVTPNENVLRRQWKLTDAFVVGYSGNLGRAHSYRTFLDAIHRIETQQRSEQSLLIAAADAPGSQSPALPSKEVRWLFIGGGFELDELRRETRAGCLQSVLFQPYQPRDRLAASLSAADVHLISLRPELEGLIVPSKFYGIVAAGRPVVFIGDPDGEIARVIRHSEIGFVVSEGDGARLAEVILLLSRNPSLAANQGKRARRLFESKYDFPKAAAAWEAVIGEVSAASKK
jgi:colanic acid biosynthesis glycosyl transferase WcaI